MALADLWEIAADALYLGRLITSVWHCVQKTENTDSSLTEALKVAEGFEDNYLPTVRAVQSAQVQYNKLRVRNLFNPDAAVDWVVSVNGTRSTTGKQGMPPMISVGMAFGHDAPSIRDGAKRLAGVFEEDGVNGQITDATFIAQLAATAIDLTEPFDSAVDDGAFELHPVTVKRIPPVTEGGAYTLPDNPNDAVYGLWNAPTVSLKLTTQNSRKE